MVSVRFWKLSTLNCLSALAHWPSVSHFVLTRSQQGSTRCDLRAEAAREWRDVLRVTEPGPALPSVFGFRQADPLGQPHMHPRLYIPHGSADSILKWTVWSSLGGPLTSLGPHLRKELFPESFPHHQPLLSLSPHPAPTPPGIILRIYWLRWLLSILPIGAKAGNLTAYLCPRCPQPHFVGFLFPILSIILFFIN